MYTTSRSLANRNRKELFRASELEAIPDTELEKYFLTKHVLLGTVYFLFDGPIASFWKLPIVKRTA